MTVSDKTLSKPSIGAFLERSYVLFQERLQNKIDFLSQLEVGKLTQEEDSAPTNFYPVNIEQSNRQFLTRLQTGLLGEENWSDLLQTEIEAELCRVNNLLQGLQQLILDHFFKAYAASFDPHTAFFSAEDEGLLLAALSNEVYSTGLVLKRTGFGIFVSQVMPYSDASRYKDISAEDEIISVQGSGGWESARCMTLPGLVLAFYGTDEGTIDVQLKSSKDQQIRSFSLEKRFLRSSQNHVFRYLMKKGDLRIAYIRFPSFYSKMTKWGNSSAEDLAIDLIELKTQDLDGLVVDLRNNGGGSIEEAVNLAGLFVDAGPLFITTNAENSDGRLHKDTRRGTVFSDKVMFLTNSKTASASEMVVSALRNYPNQLIVGAKTFGKSTGQRFVYLKSPNGGDIFGILKVTVLKIYGINGESYQGKGVDPDVLIPELTFFEAHEDQLDYHLVNPAIPKSFKPRTVRSLPLDSIQMMSKMRIQEDSVFIEIASMKKRLEQLDSNDPEAATNFLKEYASWKLPKSDPVFEVVSVEDDPAFYEQSAKLEEKALQDPVLNQAILIFEDWINQMNDE